MNDQCTISPLAVSPFRWSENQYRFTSLPSPPIHKGQPIDEYGSNAPPSDFSLPAAQTRDSGTDASPAVSSAFRKQRNELDEIIQSGFDEMDHALASRSSPTHIPPAYSSPMVGVDLRHSGISAMMSSLEHGSRCSHVSTPSPSTACSDASASIRATCRGSIKRTGSHLNVDAPCFIPRLVPDVAAGMGFRGAHCTVMGSSERLPMASEAMAAAALMNGEFDSHHEDDHGMMPTEEEQEWLDQQARKRLSPAAAWPQSRVFNVPHYIPS
mmetsp:Transcript_25741/g.78243  ORF Transcript_25741/g.78243 Transcript_25741/m.78243 type:complete len:269 (+) Transcript_25741:175-981(+)